MMRRFRGRVVGVSARFDQTVVFPNQPISLSNESNQSTLLEQNEPQTVVDGLALLGFSGEHDELTREIPVTASVNTIQLTLPIEGPALGYVNPGRVNGQFTGDEVITWSFNFTPSGTGDGSDPLFYSDGINFLIYSIDSTMHPGVANLSATIDGVVTNLITITIIDQG